MSGFWLLTDERGGAADLHAASAAALEAPPQRRIRVLRADRRALVLGSSQPAGMFVADRLERAGIDTARRRSGGSAVLVGPSDVLWVDVVVPAGDALSEDDVGRASWWLGEAWAAALSAAGVLGEIEVWKGGLRRSPWSEAICFAGLGPGEVTLDGRKVVGISQRRRRSAALLQSAALLRWEPSDYTDLVAAAPAGASEDDLAAAAAAIGADREQPVLAALLEHLARLVP